jgi:hypothetical protein
VLTRRAARSPCARGNGSRSSSGRFAARRPRKRVKQIRRNGARICERASELTAQILFANQRRGQRKPTWARETRRAAVCESHRSERPAYDRKSSATSRVPTSCDVELRLAATSARKNVRAMTAPLLRPQGKVRHLQRHRRCSGLNTSGPAPSAVQRRTASRRAARRTWSARARSLASAQGAAPVIHGSCRWEPRPRRLEGKPARESGNRRLARARVPRAASHNPPVTRAGAGEFLRDSARRPSRFPLHRFHGVHSQQPPQPLSPWTRPVVGLMKAAQHVRQR